MMQRTTMIIWVCFPCLSALAQVPVFNATTISTNSGDCKAIADIDGDGRADAILAGSAMRWFESGASFAQRTIRSSPVYQEFSTDMQAADIDADGDIDLVVGDGGGANNVLWFENPRLNPPNSGNDPRVSANWTYHVVGTHGDFAHDIEIADLDRDGRLDIVTSGHGYTRVFKQLPGVQWSRITLTNPGPFDGVFLADINADQRPDIATNQGWVETPADLAAGDWVLHTINNTLGDEVAAADLNDDGRPDLIMGDAHARGPVVWFQCPTNPTNASWTRRTIDSSMGSHKIETTDFNRDGLTDILLGLELQELSIYINRGGTTPSFTKAQLDSGAAHNARAGDMNADGYPDILAADYIGIPPLKVYLQNAPDCPADLDNGTRTGTPDGGVDVNDLLYFMECFESGASCADIAADAANPPGPDGGVDVNDILYFLVIFENGC